MKNFKRLIVWQRSMELASEVTNILDLLPKQERYTYRDQMIRCSISVPSNIAEGSSRSSIKDYKRFLRIALGSSFELETQLLLVVRNTNIQEQEILKAQGLNTEVQKMLQTLIRKLN